jgi:hypothetical protein
MIDLFRFRPAGLFSAALALAALDDVDHAPDETTDKAANYQGGMSMSVAMAETALRNCDRPVQQSRLVICAERA